MSCCLPPLLKHYILLFTYFYFVDQPGIDLAELARPKRAHLVGVASIHQRSKACAPLQEGLEPSALQDT